MACDIIFERHVCLVNWHSIDDVTDLDRITTEVTAAFQRYRRPILYVSRVAESLKPPTEAVRKALPQKFPPLLTMCPRVHAVFEGTGFMNAVKIAALSAAVTLVGKRQTFVLHSSTSELLQSVSAQDAPLVEAVFDRAIQMQAARSVTRLRAAHVAPAYDRRAG